MLMGNAMAKAFMKNGVGGSAKGKPFKHKAIKCRKCNQSNMDIKQDENFAICPNCGNYIVFTDSKK